MKKIQFLFGIHNHQPVGNFPEVLEQAYRESYHPFAEALARHPSIKWSLHASGILWDFFMDRHPEYIAMIQAMVRSGQVELLTGGYYEPIMPVIPDRDKVGQIQKLSAFLQSTFGVAPSGMWLAERVWEPQLARCLASAGIGYTVVDDAHFAAAGMDVERLRGYYVTEEQGTKLDIFPISQKLRYFIPFQTVEKTIEYFASCASDTGCAALCMADDGEKFGMWPETYKHVYQDGWLERFLSALEQNAAWIEPVTFSEYRAQAPAEGRVYLPTASYFEMSEWSLPPEAQDAFDGVVRQFEHNPSVKRFLRGGFWRNFLTKYPESNTMHKKMLYVSGRVDQLQATDPANAAAARDALYAGQCNCAYWHGVFGGLYLPHLRTAVYRELLTAESLCNGKQARPEFRSFDFDCDGRDEVVFESKQQNLYFSPHSGAALFEWDILGRQVNLQNVLTRSPESYHRRLREFLANPHQESEVKTIHDAVKVKEQNLDHYLHYDWYRRASLIDHFLHPATTLEAMRRTQYGEQGDFVLGEYRVELAGKKAVFTRAGTVWNEDRSCRITVSKAVVPQAAGFDAAYTIENGEESPVDIFFAPEFNLAFSYALPVDSADTEPVTQWVRQDEHFGLALTMKFSVPTPVWAYPVETVSLSEGGFERTYQGTVVVPQFRVRLPANGRFSVVISLNVQTTAGA